MQEGQNVRYILFSSIQEPPFCPSSDQLYFSRLITQSSVTVALYLVLNSRKLGFGVLHFSRLIALSSVTIVFGFGIPEARFMHTKNKGVTFLMQMQDIWPS